jgi:chloramphenicol 3-O phosphotransferase
MRDWYRALDLLPSAAEHVIPAEVSLDETVQRIMTDAGLACRGVQLVPGRTGRVTTQVIVLNGGSSSGKTGIARCLQAILPLTWISVSVDDLLDALPPSLMDSSSGIGLGQRGEVTIGDGFREIEAAWMTGVAAMARAGARVIIDDVFLSGAAAQERIRSHLDGLGVLWVGVRCDPTIASGREIARGDRMTGMAVSQAEIVHQGVVYDIEVDTSHTESLDCARAIAACVVLHPRKVHLLAQKPIVLKN